MLKRSSVYAVLSAWDGNIRHVPAAIDLYAVSKAIEIYRCARAILNPLPTMMVDGAGTWQTRSHNVLRHALQGQYPWSSCTP